VLVCNVSQQARRAAISVDIAEITVAVASTATGNIVFATLVDDPASVGDRVDAYLGEIMVEAASAAAAVNAGLSYAAAIVEGVTTTDVFLAAVPAVLSATVTEAATGGAAQDATVTAPSRSAMVKGTFINPSASRQAYANGIMINL
jgi:hypothetical protein